jgi:hypothetical protein
LKAFANSKVIKQLYDYFEHKSEDSMVFVVEAIVGIIRG